MTDVDPELVEAMRRRMDAMREELWDLQDENDDLRERVAELEMIVGTDTDHVAYEQMTKQQKVNTLREALIQDAVSKDGRSSMKYAEARSALGNRPSPGHTYDLMELAGEADGYAYGEKNGTKRLTVNIDAVNDQRYLRVANNATDENPA